MATINEYELARRDAGRFAREWLKNPDGPDFDRLVLQLAKILREEFPALAREHWTYPRSVAEKALKDRVTIARCRNHGGKGLAFYWPKRQGKLADARCPKCGYGLDQTSLALQVRFDRIPE
jgi:hypothetical protein